MDRPIVILSSSDPMTGIAKNVFHKLHELDSKFSYMEVLYKTFRNGEIKAKIPETVRHKEVYFFHSMRHPDVNTSLVKMLLTCDALKRASVAGITLVVPYMSYLRQDRKDEPRVPISVALMASLIQANKKIENIITMDLHVEQIQGLYDRLDDLYGSKIFAEYFRKTLVENFRKISLVSPDGGSMKRTDRFAEAFNISRTINVIEKKRSKDGKPEAQKVLGPPIRNRIAIMYDDMIDTGGSIISAASALKNRGVSKIYACATFGIFSPDKDGSAEEKFKKSGIRVVTTNAIPRSDAYYAKHRSWLTCVPIEDLLASAIYANSRMEGSISDLFK